LFRSLFYFFKIIFQRWLMTYLEKPPWDGLLLFCFFAKLFLLSTCEIFKPFSFFCNHVVLNSFSPYNTVFFTMGLSKVSELSKYTTHYYIWASFYCINYNISSSLSFIRVNLMNHFLLYLKLLCLQSKFEGNCLFFSFVRFC